MSPFARTRSRTVQSMIMPESVNIDASPLRLSGDNEDQDAGPDLFERRNSSDYGDEGQQVDESSVLSRNIQDQPEELPVELVSLTDRYGGILPSFFAACDTFIDIFFLIIRFINSLSAKVHSSPPTIEKVADLFQDFYGRAESHIATHISALASRINRDPSPDLPSKSHKSNNQDNVTSSRQMLTASEVADKRKARKFLSYKRFALEEAVERRACEAVYDKIWRHRTTLDGVRDEKLRSKTAALFLVGINLKDLGIDVDISAIDEDKQKEANDYISVAREHLTKMNEEKYPLGKLQRLSYSHKAIVDALTKLLPSSSSADEILPTLIYTLITCPAEGINIISNLLFIQRFRSESKIDGETAYCLTNLEASISFLENVDLSELRADEVQSGQTKTLDNDSASSAEKADLVSPSKEAAAPSVAAVSASPGILKASDKEALDTLSKGQPSQQRGLNNLLQPPSKMLGAANDAVRNTADQGLKNIGSSLDTSFNFLFGRLRELQSGKEENIPILPKTLAEASRLVAYPASGDNRNLAEEDNATKEPTDRPPLGHVHSKAEDTFLGLVSGRGTPRERSIDSVKSQGSSKKPPKDESSQSIAQPTPMTPLSSTPLGSVRNFGNTLNPLNHIPGVIRNFGRSVSETPSGPGSPALPERAKPSPAQTERAPSSGSVPKFETPIQRFLDTRNASELTIGDVSTLLEDYKRLATVLFKQNTNSS